MNETTPASIEEIANFLSGSTLHTIIVALSPADIRVRLCASTDSIRLSRYTADKQKKHPEITAESFLWLQELLNTGERLYDQKHHATVIWHREPPMLSY
jgi:hypothetical protein